MWNKTKSLLLSRILTWIATFIVVVLTFFVPRFSEWYDKSFSHDYGFFAESSVMIPMCIVLYVCEVFAFAVLYSLHILLANINREQVFVEQNTLCLRRISWACMFAGIAFSVLGLWRFVFLLAGFLAVMFGLIMRVLKNVFEKAVEIKSENDFTV
ncbi:MAG: DUF2975 domain-containing protein [Ruminococcus sp.]